MTLFSRTLTVGVSVCYRPNQCDYPMIVTKSVSWVRRPLTYKSCHVSLKDPKIFRCFGLHKSNMSITLTEPRAPVLRGRCFLHAQLPAHHEIAGRIKRPVSSLRLVNLLTSRMTLQLARIRWFISVWMLLCCRSRARSGLFRRRGELLHRRILERPSKSLPLCRLQDFADLLRVRGGGDNSDEGEGVMEEVDASETPDRKVEGSEDQTPTPATTSPPEEGDEPNPQVVSEVSDTEASNTDEEPSESQSPLPTVLETTTTTVVEGEAPTDLMDALQQQPDPTDTLQQHEVIDQASQLRVKGKAFHDEGDFVVAATNFASAADLLEPLIAHEAEEFVTCRLHEALCRLKASQYEEAVTACSQVLQLSNDSIEPALRARAFHRRAKAQLELGNVDEALEDARSAAFLGDRKAVALYGKLMRENSGMSSSSALSGMSDGDGSAFGSSADLLQSLLSKSSMASSPLPESSGDSSSSPFSALSLLSGMSQDMASGNQGNLAKSVLTAVSKRLEDENTQDTLCGYLQSASGPQLQQMAGMAGMQLPEEQAAKIASFCNSVTPKTIQKTLKTSKRAIYAIQLIRKVLRLIAKCSGLIVLLLVLTWIKSAVLRPIPINKRLARRATKEGAKLAKAAVA